MDNQQGPPVWHRERCSVFCNSLNEERIWKRTDWCVWPSPFAVHLRLTHGCPSAALSCDAESQGYTQGDPEAETSSRNTDDGEDCAHPLRNPSHRQEEGRSGRRDAGHARAWSSRLHPLWAFPVPGDYTLVLCSYGKEYLEPALLFLVCNFVFFSQSLKEIQCRDFCPFTLIESASY